MQLGTTCDLFLCVTDSVCVVFSLQRLRITTAATPTRSCWPSVRPVWSQWLCVCLIAPGVMFVGGEAFDISAWTCPQASSLFHAAPPLWSVPLLAKSLLCLPKSWSLILCQAGSWRVQRWGTHRRVSRTLVTGPSVPSLQAFVSHHASARNRSQVLYKSNRFA